MTYKSCHEKGHEVCSECPACRDCDDAELKRLEDEIERLLAELNGIKGAARRCDRCEISPPKTEARYVCPDCAEKAEAEVERLRAALDEAAYLGCINAMNVGARTCLDWNPPPKHLCAACIARRALEGKQ